jgi:uncharacterized membrane protein YeiH
MPTATLPAALGPILDFVDMAGIFVFALSGALLAAVKRQTVVTFFFFAVVTGVGGGTVRDLLIGAPVFWVHENHTLLICLGAGLALWLLPSWLWQGKTLLWLDAAGLAAYATYGAAKALAYGIAPLPAFAMGVITGCLGGIIRDVLAGEPSNLLSPELYVSVAGLSAALFVGLTWADVEPGLAAIVAFAAGFALRGMAILRGWALPAYRR